MLVSNRPPVVAQEDDLGLREADDFRVVPEGDAPTGVIREDDEGQLDPLRPRRLAIENRACTRLAGLGLSYSGAWPGATSPDS